MSRNKKKQHYVAQFQLRHFSSDISKKKVNIFNIQSNEHIHSVPIKFQAKENYFYGKDGFVENILSNLENEIAPIIAKIIKDENFPTQYSEDHIKLLVFTIFTKERTKKNSNNINKFVDKSIKNILQHDNSLKKYADELVFQYENSAAYAIMMIPKYLSNAMNLKMKLLINDTSNNFLLSDNPVVAYNQFLEKRKHPGGITAIGSKGVKLFLPISPKYCILIYDGWVYRIGNKKSKVITISDTAEINKINLLQVLNAEEILFFDKTKRIEQIQNLIEESKKYPEFGQLIINEYEQPHRSNKNEKSILIHHFQASIRIGMQLSFIKETKKAKKYKLEDKVVHSRKQS